MSKITEITFALKKGLPDYSSVSMGATMSISEGDDLQKSIQELRDLCLKECNADPDWIKDDKKAGVQRTIPLSKRKEDF